MEVGKALQSTRIQTGHCTAGHTQDSNVELEWQLGLTRDRNS